MSAVSSELIPTAFRIHIQHLLFVLNSRFESAFGYQVVEVAVVVLIDPTAFNPFILSIVLINLTSDGSSVHLTFRGCLACVAYHILVRNYILK
jgi:hypothetical protein